MLHNCCEKERVSLHCCRIEPRRLEIVRIPSVESTIVPSKSERIPSKVCTSVEAEKVPGVMVMVGEERGGGCSVVLIGIKGQESAVRRL